ncbi:primosomal protein N' [Sulfurisoma sediminicola]|uniref:Replication restart protein PriA n=1 Tax=Sulfurisoma sediminicola TaxID=1381557 RepID=A0A497XJX6_9PROT|nr:primosomal protein N' [Sulfurisoma sediminicola]RLJ68243.1 replication restart DNA helicase PriA [Sulfurisoma sediminicola]
MSQALDPVLQVALDVPLPRLFDYRGSAEIVPGSLVRVPFGKGVKTGVVVAVAAQSDQPADKLKAVEAVLAVTPLPSDWLALCEFVSRYYQHPLGGVMSLALPPLLRQGKLPRKLKEKPAGGAETVLPVMPVMLDEQVVAVAAISAASGFAPFLLHGITGSGKTEVYLRAIATVLERGGQAMMLVPEIALTPQLEGRVAARFPQARIAIAHSGVADAGRTRGFLDAHAGRADIVLGTRLAVFMPLPRLQLIVIDEEHDGSFKQQEGLRYSARDVAVFRAKQRGVPIVLGSATPSLETFHHATSGRYRLLELTRRAVAEAPPRVAVVDTRREKLQDGMSAALLAAMSERLQRGEQSLIFLNRRGYAPVLACPACGWISGCRRCAANLVVHLADRRLRCHHCGLEAGIPRACPDCGNVDIHPFGRGTQRLEAALSERFPEARILRIDRDSASTPVKWAALLDAIHEGSADILVGTQMLAKGHDFPKLTLVGVAGADAALFAADFRAPERLFAQLMQVGGRSGRAALAGEVLIQTEYPSHPLYQALIAHDYAAFAAAQLAEREQAGFPPYVFQALLRAEAKQLDDALAFLAAARESALALGGSVTLYDPVPMRLFRKMTLERAQLLVESASRPALQAFLTSWVAGLYNQKTPRDLRWHVDVDPLEF